MVRLTAQQDVLEELAKIIVGYFRADWVIFARQDADGKVSLRKSAGSDQDRQGLVLTEKVRDIVRDVLNTGFLAAEKIVHPEPYSAVFIPLPESDRTETVLIIAHKEDQAPSAELLNLYLALAGLAGSTLARISTEQELRMHQGHLEEIVKERTGELKATNIRLGKEVSERKKAHDELEARVEGRTRELREANQEIRKLNAELEKRVADRTAELAAANKELEAFTYSVSHDLRAPLRAIDGFSQMLARDNEDKLNEEGKRKLGVIRVNAQRMGRLIDDLLALSRLGHQAMSCSAFAMKDLAEEVWKELTVLSFGVIRPELRLDHLPRAFGDRALVKQVVSNLISNAVKFTAARKNAVIEIGGRAEGKENIFYVKDNGAGFDMRYYDKLFGIFQRLHNSQEYEGTGVGLAIVQRIIRRHGGRVWAESAPGEGATFYFTLPEEG